MKKKVYLAIIPFIDERTAKRFLERANVHGHVLNEKEVTINKVQEDKK